MPLKSKAQFRALMAKDPAVAKEFYAATPNFQALPERAHKKKALQRVRKRKHHRRKHGNAH